MVVGIPYTRLQISVCADDMRLSADVLVRRTSEAHSGASQTYRLIRPKHKKVGNVGNVGTVVGLWVGGHCLRRPSWSQLPPYERPF